VNDCFEPAELWARQNAERFLRGIYPEGRREGHHFVVGSLNGEQGESLKIDIEGEHVGRWMDFATGESNGSLLNLFRLKRGIPKDDHDALFRALAAFGMPDVGWQFRDVIYPPIDWPKYVAALDVGKLASYRGWPLEFCEWLKTKARIGMSGNAFAWPIRQSGQVIGAHCFKSERTWIEPTDEEGKAVPLRPLVWGSLKSASKVHFFEGQWDACSVQILSGRQEWHKDPTQAFVITRGSANNGGKVTEFVPTGTPVVLWPQDDRPRKNGKIPSEDWLNGVVKKIGRRVSVVRLPGKHDTDWDHNDWLRSLGDADPLEELQRIMASAEVIEPPKLNRQKSVSMPQGINRRSCCRGALSVMSNAPRICSPSWLIRSVFLCAEKRRSN
jgi:hypothetical protein